MTIKPDPLYLPLYVHESLEDAVTRVPALAPLSALSLYAPEALALLDSKPGYRLVHILPTCFGSDLTFVFRRVFEYPPLALPPEPAPILCAAADHALLAAHAAAEARVVSKMRALAVTLGASLVLAFAILGLALSRGAL